MNERLCVCFVPAREGKIEEEIEVNHCRLKYLQGYTSLSRQSRVEDEEVKWNVSFHVVIEILRVASCVSLIATGFEWKLNSTASCYLNNSLE
jgi:hypothetical protein